MATRPRILPFGSIETIPVDTTEPMIGAMVAGGLMEFPAQG